MSSNEVNAAQTLRTSQDNQQVQALLARLAEAGLETGEEPTANKVEVPIDQAHPDQNPVVDYTVNTSRPPGRSAR